MGAPTRGDDRGLDVLAPGRIFTGEVTPEETHPPANCGRDAAELMIAVEAMECARTLDKKSEIVYHEAGDRSKSSEYCDQRGALGVDL